MGVFEFVIVLVVVTTIGKVVTDVVQTRSLPPGAGTGGGEVEQLREAVSDLSDRLHTLEEERDFYRNLLEAPREDRPAD